MIQTWGDRLKADVAGKLADIRELAAAGVPVMEVAERLGTTKSCINSLLDREGVYISFARKKHSKTSHGGAEFQERLARRTALSRLWPAITVTEAAEREGITEKAMVNYSGLHRLEWKPRQNWI